MLKIIFMLLSVIPLCLHIPYLVSAWSSSRLDQWVFLLDAGIQIVPSDMGEHPLNGMHGFAPEDEHSFAAVLSNTAIPEYVNNVKDYYKFMIERAEKL